MAWGTPLTAVADTPLTASQWNASVRDNLLETAVAKATAAGRTIVTNGANSLVERVPTSAYIATTEANGSTTWANLATGGPDVNITTGATALILLTTGMFNNTANAEAYYGWSVTGATTIAANATDALRHTSSTPNAQLVGTWAYIVALTAGANNFRAKYQVSSNTGTWFDRRLTVMSF